MVSTLEHNGLSAFDNVLAAFKSLDSLRFRGWPVDMGKALQVLDRALRDEGIRPTQARMSALWGAVNINDPAHTEKVIRSITG